VNILLGEDEILIAMEQQLYLETAGYSVTGPAATAQDALMMVGTRRHDLALVDVHLACNSSGILVARQLTAVGVPCLFITSHPEEVEASGVGLGCLIKPFSERELICSVEIAMDIMAGRLPASPLRNLILFDPARLVENTRG
jgi:two-component system, response regulator PdtaR